MNCRSLCTWPLSVPTAAWLLRKQRARMHLPNALLPKNWRVLFICGCEKIFFSTGLVNDMLGKMTVALTTNPDYKLAYKLK